MIENIKYSIRILKRNPLLLYISVPGLAVGVCAILMLIVYLKYELSFDKHFPTHDRVLRLCNTEVNDNSRTLSISLRTAYTQLPAKVPEIEKAVQMYPGWQSKVETENASFKDLTLMYADPEFFDVFGLKLLQGNVSDALAGKTNIVLTKSTAEKLFGPGICIGKSFKLDNKVLIVTGVLNDLPKTTHFNFDMLQPLASNDFITQQGSLEFTTYYLIKEGSDLDKTRKEIAAVNDELMVVWKARGPLNNNKTETTTELLSDIHFHTKAQDDMVPRINMSQLYLIVAIAVFIFVIALINFINMYLLHGEKRIQEISTRRVAGASRWTLSIQFFSETGIIALGSLILGLGLAILAQPYFAKLISLPVTISDILTPVGVISIISLLLLIVFITGSYPGYFLSRVEMISGLKGKHLNLSRGRFSKIVVLVQFFITVLLISSLVITRAQIRYMKNTPLGFDLSDVIIAEDLSDQLANSSESLKMELEKLSFVQSVGLSQHMMGGRCSGQWISLPDNKDVKPIKEYRVLSGFCQTLKLQLVGGEYFSQNNPGQKEIILNNAAVKMLGINYTPGMKVIYKDEPVIIKGIVRDFFFDGYAGKNIDPLVLIQVDKFPSVIYIRHKGIFTMDQQKQLVTVFKNFDPVNLPSFAPLGDIYKAKFTQDDRVYKMVSCGALLAIILSFTGLFSLAILNVNRRTKEIGIRKVIGSTEYEIIRELVYEVLILVGLASITAFVTAFIIMKDWLSHYATRINMNVSYFIVSGLMALVIALLSVGWQSWRAATRNPVEALRYE